MSAGPRNCTGTPPSKVNVASRARHDGCTICSTATPSPDKVSA